MSRNRFMASGMAVALSIATLLVTVEIFAQERNQIRIVGSSTFFPFATTVAENFGRTTQFPAPIIEATGTGEGFQLFCRGIGTQHPDINNASRRINESELMECTRNGVDKITEVKVGYGGIVIANVKTAEQQNFSFKEIYLALAKYIPDPEGGEQLVANPYKKWNEINAALPDYPIKVLGPPLADGTREVFVKLVMEAGCKAFDKIKAMAETNEAEFEQICHTLRDDGAFVESGENDVLIVQQLMANPQAFGIFGFDYLYQNQGKIQAASINGVEPSFESIGNESYPVSRPLYCYVKNVHVGVIPGIEAYVKELTSPRAWGPTGYLAEKGLIPLPEQQQEKMRQQALNFHPVRLADL